MSASVCTASAKRALDPELDDTQTFAPKIKMLDPMAILTARDSESSLYNLPNLSDRCCLFPPRSLQMAGARVLTETQRSAFARRAPYRGRHTSHLAKGLPCSPCVGTQDPNTLNGRLMRTQLDVPGASRNAPEEVHQLEILAHIAAQSPPYTSNC